MTGPAVRRRGRLAALCVSAALAVVPVLGIPQAGVSPSTAAAITPAESAAAGYVPDPAPAAVRVSLGSVSPEVFDGSTVGGTTGGVPTVTITGTIRNVGRTPVTGVEVRMQRGPRLTNPAAIREPLVWPESDYALTGPFQSVTETLDPGAEVAFQISMPALPVPDQTPTPVDLRLVERGVYPLLVNVNGDPDGTGIARLDDARTLLPVLRVPVTGNAAADPAGNAGNGPADPSGNRSDPGSPDRAPEATADPAAPDPAPPLTVVLPVATAPTRLAHIPGSDGPEPVVALAADSLPRELGPEGRLTGLLEAADRGFSGPGGAQLRQATCIAVDPDLVDTAEAIAAGRPVIVDDGQPVPDSLAEDARHWLDRLRTTVGDGCLVALGAAQADLDAVASVDDRQLVGAALDRPGTLTRVLGRPPIPDLLLPASGTMDPGTPRALGVTGGAVITAATATRTDTGRVPDPGVVELADVPGLRAVTFDPVLGASLAATGSRPENPRYSAPDTRYWLEADSPAARLQDARAALLAPLMDQPPPAADDATDPDDDTDAPSAPPDPGVFVVPPAVWSVDGDSAASLLRLLGNTLDSGALRPEPLTERLTGPVTVPAGSLTPHPTGAGDPGAVDETTIDGVRRAMSGLETLQRLVDSTDPRSQYAAAHLAPITGDALRALSVTGRRAGGDGITLDSETGQIARSRTTERLDHLDATVRGALGRIDLLPPGSVFTMASPNSPLLLVARNGLPFPIQVSVDIDAPEGLRVEPVDTVRVPASGSRTLQLPTEASDQISGRQTVRLTLLDTEGRPLSQPVELEVQSGRYPLAVVFTLAAGALALVLVGRRYLRYRRGTPDPADEGHRP